VTPVSPGLAAALSDRYRLDRELGQGGMATVYLAHDLRNNRKVALKVLRPELAAILGAERFLKEIETTANLQHPHILPLFESGKAVGRVGGSAVGRSGGSAERLAAEFLFYVMPFVEGESLRDRLNREKQLPLDEALRLTTEIAEALEYAHQQGVIHRDIKPENILLSRGHALVADFGIALAVTQAGGGRLTETGLSLGTPAYMSPEQSMAEADLDARTDQYSLACVLYEMLAGEPPYTGPTAQAIIAKRLREPVPRLSTVREVPPAVEQAVTRALAKAKADRFTTVGGFQRALLAPASKARPRLSRGLSLALAILLVAGAAISVRAFLHRPPAVSVSHRQLTFTGDASRPTVSPDGHWLAYVQGRPGEAPRLIVQELSTDPRPLVVASPLAMSRWVGWNSIGDTLYFAADGSGPDSGSAVFAVSRAGGSVRRTSISDNYLALSSDRETLYQTRGFSDSSVVTDTISVIAGRSGTTIRRFTVGIGAFLFGGMVSPDGLWLAAVAIRGNATFLCLISTDGRLAQRLVERVPRHTSLAWNRGSTAVYYLRDLGNGANLGAGLDLMKVAFDPRTGAPRGEPRVVVGGASIRDFATAPDRNLLVYTKAPSNQKLWAMNLAPGDAVATAREFSLGTSVYGTPDLSPDGRWVAYAQNDRGFGKLFVTPFDSSAPRPLPTPSADAWSPRWSADGRALAYASTDPQSPGVFVLEPAFGGQARQVTSSGLTPAGRLSWSPDGGTLMFPVDFLHYALVDVGSGRADTIVPPKGDPFHLTAFSPDGTELVVGWPHLLRGPRTGDRWTRLETPPVGVDPFLWGRDGWIYFGLLIWGRAGEGDPVGFREIWRTRVDASHAELYARLPELCSWWEISLSADARRLVCTVNKAEPDIWIAEHFDPEER
jgi:serine/threonine-protein kinase